MNQNAIEKIGKERKLLIKNIQIRISTGNNEKPTVRIITTDFARQSRDQEKIRRRSREDQEIRKGQKKDIAVDNVAHLV